MNLTAKSFELRKDILDLVCQGKCGHIGGDLSVLDLLVTLYYKQMRISKELAQAPDRDRFILSKGHSVEALYVVLADLGFFPKKELSTYASYGSSFIGHPNNKINGIEMNSGSLGHGLSVSVGMALAGKMDEADYRVYVVMGDGELAEGSVWEGFMAGSHYHLDNLCAVIDRNHLQISGATEEVMGHEPLEERLKSFGWNVITTKGNHIPSLDAAFEEAKTAKGRPSAIIANTIKGYGVSFIENKAIWHHKIPNAEEYSQAIKELEERRGSADE